RCRARSCGRSPSRRGTAAPRPAAPPGSPRRHTSPSAPAPHGRVRQMSYTYVYTVRVRTNTLPTRDESTTASRDGTAVAYRTGGVGRRLDPPRLDGAVPGAPRGGQDRRRLRGVRPRRGSGPRAHHAALADEAGAAVRAHRRRAPARRRAAPGRPGRARRGRPPG